MWQERVIDEADLGPFLARCGNAGLPSRLRALYEHQRRCWPRLRRSHEAMERAETRRIELEGCWVLCRHTPHRMASVSARVDPVSIQERPCFLCSENLDPQEKGVVYAEDYLILCNVSPIFPFHLVISHRDHLPQEIQPHFSTALNLVRDLSPDFVLIYNGPRCGASAPDHFHFQAFPGENLPLESQVWTDDMSGGEPTVVHEGQILVRAPGHFSRRLLTYESRDPTVLSLWLDRTLHVLAGIKGSAGEPMINLLMAYREGLWKVILFPRARHRPLCYDDRHGCQLLISPGAIDMAGVFIIPRRRDFDRVHAESLAGIYREVTLGGDHFSRLVRSLTTQG